MIRLAAALALLPVVAMAQQAPPCLPPEMVPGFLAERYGEHRHARMLTTDGHLIEIWGKKGGSWTMTVTRPGGMTCLALAGDMFDPEVMPLPDAGEAG